MIPVGLTPPFHVLVQPKEGYNHIILAAEGEQFDSMEHTVDWADSCNFGVENALPKLRIDQMLVDGQPQNPSKNNLNLGIFTNRIVRDISLVVLGTDDVSSRLQLGCQLMNKGIDVKDGISCAPSLLATNTLGLTGEPTSVSLKLRPGKYELRLWVEDEDSGISEVQSLQINVPYPLYLDALIVLGVISILIAIVFLVLTFIRKRNNNRRYLG